MKKITRIAMTALSVAATAAIADAANSYDASTHPTTQTPSATRTTPAMPGTMDNSQATNNVRGINGDVQSQSQQDQQSANGISQVNDQRKNNQLQSSDLVGADVTDGQQHVVGTISDLELSQDGSIEAAYVDIGGILGIGSTTYRVPFDQLSVSHQQGNKFQVQIQQDSLQALASLSPDLQNDMKDWSKNAQNQVAQAKDQVSDQAQNAQDQTQNAYDRASQNVQGGLAAAGDSFRHAGNEIKNGAQQAADTITAEARQVKDQIRSHLKGNNAQDQLANVNVKVDQDKVTLSGTVDSDAAHKDIKNAAQKIANGRKIVDNIDVNADSNTSRTASMD